MRVFVSLIYLAFILSVILLVTTVYYYWTFIFDIDPEKIHYPHPE
jgi:cytochrome bd-type quinol oxidase subunit 2